MKHILLIAALLASFAFCPLGADAQGVIVKPKPKPNPVDKPDKAKQEAARRRQQEREAARRRQREQEAAQHRNSELNKLAQNMVYVQGGTFTMGASNDEEAYADEKPAHKVTLSSFYICKYEVTQSLWEAVMGCNPSKFKGDNLPVERVSWDDCQQFISKLNALTGQHYRLPTEAEWEFAARGGNSSRGYKYSGSSTLSDVAWYDDNSGNKTHPVGTKSPNELGLYDMTGNVCEWCSDWYGDYNSSAQTNPAGPSRGTYRVYRGGSWNFIAGGCRASCRGSNTPGNRSGNLGLRLVRS